MKFMRTKPLSQILGHGEGKRLKPSLGALDLTLLGIGCIIGTGIFVLTGVAAAKYAGPALVISFVLSGLACAFAALAYAEMAAMVPAAGSAYTYSYATLGELIAWIVGWNLILEYTVGASAVAAGWSGYMTGILKAGGIILPEAFTRVPSDGGIVDLPAMLIVALITFLLVLGTTKSAKFNRLLVAVKVAAVFIFLLIATPHVDTANWSDFMPYGFWPNNITLESGEIMSVGVVAGAAIIFFAYVGFDAVATAAEESKNPNRDMPIGIIGSLLVCTALYIAVSAVMTGIVPYTQFGTPEGAKEPLAFALRSIGYDFGGALVATGAICGITTVLLVLIYGQTRIFFVMARDGLIPEKICVLHKKYHTPYVVTIITGIAVAAIAGFTPIHRLAELANIGTLFAFVVVSVGVMVLRKTKPDMKRPFRCPAVWVVGPCAILSCSYLMYALPIHTWERFIIWSAIGLVVYFLYSYRKSPLNAEIVPEGRISPTDTAPNGAVP